MEEIKFYIEDDKKALKELGLKIDELEITNATSKEISDKLTNNDYIFVAGGNSFYLLQEMKKTGTDKIISRQINDGKIIMESEKIRYLDTPFEYRSYPVMFSCRPPGLSHHFP